MWQKLVQQLQQGNIKAVARAISLAENSTAGYEALLSQLTIRPADIIGITGAPGAGKSTLVDGLVGEYIKAGKKVGVLCVDPSSPFTMGAVLGDRVRMREWYNHPQVYIRSLATRGRLGGLSPAIIETTDIMKAAGYDVIIIETVGVGQSEVEIAGLADTTVVVMVPEGGDEVQTMKAGLMEIADIFVVNKADRPGADIFIKNLHLMLAPAFRNRQAEIPVLKTVALQKQGVPELYEKLTIHAQNTHSTGKKFQLQAERAYQLIQQKRMRGVNKTELAEIIQQENTGNFNLYKFVERY
ncbi:MAG TPA: methylmalonyl Co-A mutase-associated GTPase MeaB [Chitinophagaceae bacterium]|nr:methylmalonyl Co-A mutase-associated GTPase MeaB [Chitinophagaceae bacterium]